MNNWAAITFALVASLVSTDLEAAQIEVVQVSGGDTLALADAIETANDSAANTRTHIRISGDYHFTDNFSLPSIRSDVVLNGFGITHTRLMGTGVAGDNDRLIHVSEGGSLLLRYIDIVNFHLGGPPNDEQHPLIENWGKLELQSVHIEDVEARKVDSPLSPPSATHPAIVNHSVILADGLSLLNVGIYEFVRISEENRPVVGSVLSNYGSATLENLLVAYNKAPGEVGTIMNRGDLTLLNATYIGPDSESKYAPVAIDAEGTTQVANSIFGAAYSGAWCQEAASLGGNLVFNAGCEFDSDADLVGLPLGLDDIERVSVPWHGEVASHPIVAPSFESLAATSALAQWCPSTDILQQNRLTDRNDSGMTTCDRGAVALRGASLGSGGATGWFYDPHKNGHYVSILDNVHNVLVGWRTFDRFGNQAWIYATGSLEDERYFEAEAYINLGGRLTEEGPVEISRAVPWGRIQLEFQSCREVRFEFETNDDRFGSGGFDLIRLANSRQLVCED